MDYFELINLLSDSTLEIIKLDLDRQYQDLLTNIQDKESTIEAHRNSGEPWTVSIAEMESLVRVHWFQLELTVLRNWGFLNCQRVSANLKKTGITLRLSGSKG
jgi:hypothetical protein